MKNDGQERAEMGRKEEEEEEALTMLEQLLEHYENFCLPLGIKSHVVCYHNYRPDEKIPIEYHFPKGIFTINCFSGDAIHWNYLSK